MAAVLGALVAGFGGGFYVAREINAVKIHDMEDSIITSNADKAYQFSTLNNCGIAR